MSTLVSSYDLLCDMAATLDIGTMKTLLLMLYELAVNQGAWDWVTEARLNSRQYFSREWINDNLKYQAAGMCRDVRLKTFPSIERVSTDAAIHPSTDVHPHIQVHTHYIDSPSDVCEIPNTIIHSDNNSTQAITSPPYHSVEPAQQTGDKECMDNSIKPSATHYLLPLKVTCYNDKIKVTCYNQYSCDKTDNEPPLKKQKLYKHTPCPLKGCGVATRMLKRHVENIHLPLLFRDCEEGRNVAKYRMSALSYLASLLHPGSSIGDMVAIINSSSVIPSKSEVDNRQARAMHALCLEAGWKEPNFFSIRPVNSNAALIHWRVLLGLVGYFSEGERFLFKTEYDDPERHIQEETQPGESTLLPRHKDRSSSQLLKNYTVSVPRYYAHRGHTSQMTMKAPAANVTLEAIEGHFHLDRTRRKLWGQFNNATTEDIIAYSTVPEPTLPVHVVGGVDVYCDPEWYPERPINQTQWKVAVGIHPKKIGRLNKDRFNQLTYLLKSPTISALGEVGLDYTDPVSTWLEQERVLRQVLQLCSIYKPIIFHFRGKDPDDEAAYTRCLEIVKEYCSPEQPIHLHCFTGRPLQVHSWLRHFHNCYFGFTGLVESFVEQQVHGLLIVPENRLLIETDSPYMAPQHGLEVNTPSYIGDVAVKVALFRTMSYERLLQLTVENARQLYNIAM